MRALTFVGAALATTLFAASAHAQTPAIDSNRGFRTHLGPTIILPAEGGSWGGGLEFGLRYGIKTGPVILGPGGRVAGYYVPKRFVGDIMPTLRVTLPAGPFAPFVEGGAGPGALTNPGEGGLAVLVGGGLMVHFGRHFALGARIGYETIVSTDFKVLSIGPMLQFGF